MLCHHYFKNIKHTYFLYIFRVLLYALVFYGIFHATWVLFLYFRINRLKIWLINPSKHFNAGIFLPENKPNIN